MRMGRQATITPRLLRHLLKTFAGRRDDVQLVRKSTFQGIVL